MKHTAQFLLATLLTVPSHAFDTPNEHINKTFELADGARVEVSMIPGLVEIETAAGSQAIVDIVRTAPTHADLDCGGVSIEHSPTKLEIRSVDHCTIVRGSQHVKLRVPRGADVTLEYAGFVRVGPTAGMLELESIAGHVEVASLRETRMSSLAAGLALTLSGVGERGVHVSSVVGGIQLGVPKAMDAELLARSVSGRVRGDAAGLRFVEDDESNYRAILGAGGRKIVLESVVGTVRIHN